MKTNEVAADRFGDKCYRKRPHEKMQFPAIKEPLVHKRYFKEIDSSGGEGVTSYAKRGRADGVNIGTKTQNQDTQVSRP